MGAESDPKPKSFEAMADQSEPGILAELYDFLKHNKKWWLVPILLVLGLFGVLMALAATGAAPFIYTMF